MNSSRGFLPTGAFTVCEMRRLNGSMIVLCRLATAFDFSRMIVAAE